MLKAEVIAIGDEILIGQVLNTNAQWIGAEVDSIGVKPVQFTTITDEDTAITVALDIALERADIVLITGGLGPTKDDLTKYTLAKYFDSELVLNQERLAYLEDYCNQRGKELNELNKTQALVPEKCFLVPNEVGSACGMLFETKDNKWVFSMPGVPFEMKDMMRKVILPKIVKEKIGMPILHRTIKTFGIWESDLAIKIEDWENNLPSHIKLAYLPNVGQVRLRLSGSHKDEKLLEADIAQEVNKLSALIPEFIFGEGKEELEDVVGELLSVHGFTVSTAESCTGGYLAHRITGVPGSSSYYQGSVIAYSNTIKVQELNVSENSLESYGAVSEEVVKQMAQGIRKKYNTDFGISCSGIAGPDGGTEQKPVGTIWIALASEEETITKKLVLSKNRKRNIHLTSSYCLNLLREKLLLLK